MEHEAKIHKLCSKISVDGFDLVDLTNELKRRFDNEEDYEEILEDIIKVKDDVLKSVQNLKKELR